MRFSVCLIAPETYKYSHFLYDTCKYYCYTIEAAGHECCMVQNHLYSDRINIIIGAHNITDPASVEQIRNAGKYVVLQSEVLTEDSISGWPVQEYYAKIYLPLLRQADAVWDSLESNKRQLKRFGIHAELHSRVGYLSAMEEITHKENKDIDFLYYGSLTPHRKQLLDELQKRGGNIVCVFDEAAIFRNDLIARARVNLAPNQASRVDHLSSRVLYLLNNRSIVVAERCYNQGWVEHCFLSASVDEWVDLCLETIRRPDLDQLSDKFFEQYKKLDMVDLIKPLIAKLACSAGSNRSCKSLADTRLCEEHDLHLHFNKASSSAMQTDGIIMGMTSIIIVTDNRLRHTKECVENIARHTPEPHQIIFVDNASTDGTVKWLRRIVQDNAKYRLIENKKNLGFAKGCNQGIEESAGEYVLLLNDEVVVTENWLSGLLECLNGAPDAGIAGPMTNNISGPQKVRDAEYKTMGRMHDYAKSFRERYRSRRIPVRRIDGFCMFFRRQLVDIIGLMDESFGTGNCADRDYCLRAALAGFRNLIAGDVFIHRHSRVIGNISDSSSSMSGNIEMFDKKWTSIAVNTPLGKKFTAFNFVEKADGLNQRGQLEKAIGMVIEGIKYTPEEKDLYYQLAEMLLDHKRYKDALEAIHSMPAGAKDDLKRLEIIAYCTEDLEEAGKYVERIFEIDKDYAPAWNLKGILAYKHGDNTVAEGCFRRAIAVAPGYGEPYTNRGMLKWTSEQKEEALDLLEKGFILSPTATDNVTLYHSAITALDQFEGAERIFQDAKELYPANKRILFFLIDILIKQGKFEMAMHEVERAMLNIGIDDGMLAAALAVREKVGRKSIAGVTRGKTISLCLIAKNEEDNLPKCLFSAAPAVDEIIVIDTGSTDRTKDIATAFGAKVYDYEWNDDFSAARNESLSRASGDWIFILDCDEVISQRDYVALRKLVDSKKIGSAYAFTTRNYMNCPNVEGWVKNDGLYSVEEAGNGWIPSCKVRLVPNDRTIRFENPVHELLEPSLKRAGKKILNSGIPIHHYGKLVTKKCLSKGEEYYQLGKKKLEGKDDDSTALLELAIQAAELQKYEEAVDLWHRLLKLDPTFAKAHFNLGYAYLKLGRYDEGIKSSKRALEFDPNLKEAIINYATCEVYGGEVKNAEAALEGMLSKYQANPPETSLLSVTYIVQEKIEEGIRYLEKLKQMNINCPGSMYVYAKEFVRAGRLDCAIRLLETAVLHGYKSSEIVDMLSGLKK